MPHSDSLLILTIAWLFIVSQVLYLLSFGVDSYLFMLPINLVKPTQEPPPPGAAPHIILFYPVLRELEETMHTTMVSLSRLDYPQDRYRVVAIPNADDPETVASLQRLRWEFPFLEVLQVPATTDPTWQSVWDDWDANSKVYWWHKGPRAGVRDLPPKKTRQLIYAFYHMARTENLPPGALINYIDADSCPPSDHFAAGAEGMRTFDVLQAQNVAGNLNSSLAASLHAFDHMGWDGRKYPHMSANGRQPFWVLGKGLFFRASDLLELGGFNPWLAIEDPEVGMRFWINGKRLGIIENPLIEEVPETFAGGFSQRKRWVCGFFQSLGAPLTALGYTPTQRLKAWMNFLPCLFMLTNLIGIPTGAWALWLWWRHSGVLPDWTVILAAINLLALIVSLGLLYAATWRRTALVLKTRRERLWYMLRVNPIVIMAWWTLWIIPLITGFSMYIGSGGLIWDRTKKVNANQALVEGRLAEGRLPSSPTSINA